MLVLFQKHYWIKKKKQIKSNTLVLLIFKVISTSVSKQFYIVLNKKINKKKKHD